MGSPEERGSSEVKWFENLLYAGHPDFCFAGMTKARAGKLHKGPLSWWKKVLGTDWTSFAGKMIHP